MIPQLHPPYMPTEFLPGSFGRYRQYPRSVRAQIPGTGYDVGRMAWAEQQLNLTGNQAQTYGSYATVPLRGLGDSGDGLGAISPAAMRLATTSMMSAPAMTFAPNPGSDDPLAPLDDLAPPGDLTSQLQQAAREAQGTPVEEAGGFFSKKVGPVPVWALALGGVAVAGGGAWFLLRKKRPKKNRRRRR